MADEWREVTLGDILSFFNGKSSPRRSNGLPYPVYGSNGIIGFSDEANAEKNTIIVGRVGSYCGSLYYSDKDCWVTDNAIRANAIDGHEARFLFFLLQTLSLNDRRAGSGQPLLNQTILSSIPVTVPLPPEQRAIAHILGTLDDKIELNRRMNQTLEAMARALFKSWFVDFDPVRAKMAGRDPGLPQDTSPTSSPTASWTPSSARSPRGGSGQLSEMLSSNFVKTKIPLRHQTASFDTSASRRSMRVNLQKQSSVKTLKAKNHTCHPVLFFCRSSTRRSSACGSWMSNQMNERFALPSFWCFVRDLLTDSPTRTALPVRQPFGKNSKGWSPELRKAISEPKSQRSLA